MKTFKEIIEKVLEHEGGYVNDPKDLGGETKYGITKRFYPDIDIKNLTIEQATEIYKKDYWDKNKVESLPQNLWHIYFDMCVNMGKRTAVKVLQRAEIKWQVVMNYTNK
jgi:lysozyme family protein